MEAEPNSEMAYWQEAPIWLRKSKVEELNQRLQGTNSHCGQSGTWTRDLPEFKSRALTLNHAASSLTWLPSHFLTSFKQQRMRA